jgi:predicted small lipoprotein YifL
MNIFRSKVSFWMVILMALGAVCLSACGQKGDLYLPDDTRREAPPQD